MEFCASVKTSGSISMPIEAYPMAVAAAVIVEPDPINGSRITPRPQRQQGPNKYPHELLRFQRGVVGNFALLFGCFEARNDIRQRFSALQHSQSAGLPTF